MKDNFWEIKETSSPANKKMGWENIFKKNQTLDPHDRH